MLILLPPSESKTGRTRGRPLELARLSFPELTESRHHIAQALAKASAHEDAASTLGVSPSLSGEIARNLVLERAPALPAARVYSGVLYDALDYASLDTSARRRANRWIVVVSALFGAVRPTDPIVPYRLSMAVNLPGIGPLASAWRPELRTVLPQTARRGVIVDCRSSTYAAAWAPEGALTDRWVQIRVPGATHMAKHTRGVVARHLCQMGEDPRSVPALAEVVAATFDVTLHEPARTGQPWVLDVSAR